jgi:hypothetical protein
VIVSSYVAGNSEVLGKILMLYFPSPSLIADVTWGRGSFWAQQVTANEVRIWQTHEFAPDGRTPPWFLPPNYKEPETRHQVMASDLQTGTDFRKLPFDRRTFDGLVLDPPYAGQGSTGGNIKSDGSIAKASSYGTITGYGNGYLGSRSTAKILDLYYEGITEARRVLKRDGILVVKCMDQIESGRQVLLHVDIINHCRERDWEVLDIFYVTAKREPLWRKCAADCPTPHKHYGQQYHSRKNISIFILFRTLARHWKSNVVKVARHGALEEIAEMSP